MKNHKGLEIKNTDSSKNGAEIYHYSQRAKKVKRVEMYCKEKIPLKRLQIKNSGNPFETKDYKSIPTCSLYWRKIYSSEGGFLINSGTLGWIIETNSSASPNSLEF